MRIVALLTAKGNNTLRRKNLLPINGEPLLLYPAKTAKACSLFTDYYVSSDDLEILNLCKDYNYKIIKRPKKLATPESQHVDVINHSLSRMKKDNIIPDILVVLMGNTVCIKRSWLTNAIELLLNNKELTSVCPVYEEFGEHPYRARKLNKNGCLEPYFNFSQEISTNRQDLPPNYFFCHNFWALRLFAGKLIEDGYAPWCFMGKNVKPLIVKESFDVHDKNDIAASKRWVKLNQNLD